MPIDNTTTNFAWQLPDASNALSYDVLRVINAISAIDAAVFARPTTAVVDAKISTAISNLVDTSPATLDTLNELAAALGDDPNFATTMTNSLAQKLGLAGGTLTGLLTLAAAGLALTEGLAPDANGKLALVSGALKYMRGGTVREVVDDSSAQTLTNKTMTSPVLNGGTLNGIAAGATVKDGEGNNQTIGYMGIPAKPDKVAAYTLELDDAFFEIPTNSGVTIPSNATVAFPIGTMVSVRNNGGAGIVIGILTDSLIWEGKGTVGDRTLAANGIALLKKITATSWLIMGSALT